MLPAVAEYLWSLPQHREAWRALAREEGGRGLYLRFVDVICNDVQYLLDDTLKILPEVRGRAHGCRAHTQIPGGLCAVGAGQPRRRVGALAGCTCSGWHTRRNRFKAHRVEP